MDDVEMGDKAKGELVAQLIEQGWPRDKASIAVDMADHATREALKAFSRIVATAGDAQIMSQASVMGLQFLELIAGAAHTELAKTMRALGVGSVMSAPIRIEI